MNQNKQDVEQWEIEFDEKFVTAIGGVLVLKDHDMLESVVATKLKQFISDLISKTRLEAVEEVISRELKCLSGE